MRSWTQTTREGRARSIWCGLDANIDGRRASPPQITCHRPKSSPPLTRGGSLSASCAATPELSWSSRLHSHAATQTDLVTAGLAHDRRCAGLVATGLTRGHHPHVSRRSRPRVQPPGAPTAAFAGLLDGLRRGGWRSRTAARCECAAWVL